MSMRYKCTFTLEQNGLKRFLFQEHRQGSLKNTIFKTVQIIKLSPL